TGAQVCVVHPRKTKLKAGFAAKTDRLAARRPAARLGRPRGGAARLPTGGGSRRASVVSVYIPPPAVRELRELCRGRHQVVRLRTRLAQMIRSLLLRNGVGEPPRRQLFAPRALAWLTQVQ